MSKHNALGFQKPKLQKPKFIRPEILLHPNIPKPLHGMNPRTILGDSWWNEVRQKAYAENNYCCWACGIHKSQAKYHQWLEAHECYRINYIEGTAVMIEIVALCHSCHHFIHSGRLEMIHAAGEISTEKYLDIIAHGTKIERKIKRKTNPYVVGEEGYTASWNKWALYLEGKKYLTRFKSYEEWYNFYNEDNGVDPDFWDSLGNQD